MTGCFDGCDDGCRLGWRVGRVIGCFDGCDDGCRDGRLKKHKTVENEKIEKRRDKTKRNQMRND